METARQNRHAAYGQLLIHAKRRPSTYAYLVATAWHSERPIATLTVWSDGVNFALIDDVAVHPDHRGQGIGSLLVTAALSRLESAGITSVQVLPIPGREPFFARLGFIVQPNAAVMDRRIPIR